MLSQAASFYDDESVCVVFFCVCFMGLEEDKASQLPFEATYPS